LLFSNIVIPTRFLICRWKVRIKIVALIFLAMDLDYVLLKLLFIIEKLVA
jgi:hypothetical protein